MVRRRGVTSVRRPFEGQGFHVSQPRPELRGDIGSRGRTAVNLAPGPSGQSINGG